MIGWLVSEEWGTVWKKLVVDYWWHFRNLYLSKTVNNYNHVYRLYSRGSNLLSLEYKI